MADQAPLSTEKGPRDSRGRDTRIHGIVLDDAHPARTLRELLRQWSESGLIPPGDLLDRTNMVLNLVNADGVVEGGERRG